MLKIKKNIKNIIPYQAGKTIEEIKKKYNLKKIIKLASNENSIGTSKLAIKAIRDNIKNINRYPDGSSQSLKSKLSKRLKVSTNNIIIANGSNEIIELLFRTFINKNDSILTCSPTFSFYKICAQTTEGNFLEIPLKNYTFDLKTIEKKITKNTKIIIICNPNNPTGTSIDKEELESFIKNLPDNIILAIDEAYYEFNNSKNKINGIDFIKKFPEKNIIILRTFSKIYGLSSLRIGYGISNKEIIDYLNRVRQPFNVNLFAQVAAEAALDDKLFFKKTLDTITEGKKYIYSEFDKLKIKYLKSYTNFIFFELPYDNNFIFERLLEKGIIIRSLKSFGYNNALRVTIGTEKENKFFIKSLKKVLKELNYNF